MQRRRLTPAGLWTLRWALTCAIGAIAVGALVAVHVFLLPSATVPDAYKLPKQREIGYRRQTSELSWMQETAPPQLSKLRISTQKVGNWRGDSEFLKLWKPPPNRNFVPCVAPSSSYLPPSPSRGYLLVHSNGGLNQMRAGISDMVAVARLINATLVIPQLDKRSFWQDSSNFSNVFDEEHFIQTLVNDVKVVKKLPVELMSTPKAIIHFRSWSGSEYYQNEISRMWDNHLVIKAAKSDSRLANNNLPSDIQKLRCRAFFEALRFAPKIEGLGKLLVERMRSYGPYIALHLRYEKDMLAFSGCTYGLSPVESDELARIRENISYWKVKEIDPQEQRARGYCPLTPKEVGIFLSSLGYPSSTPIYIAAGSIYGGHSHLADLESRFPILLSKSGIMNFVTGEVGISRRA
ncbi:hypothetical protein Cni_G21250 [Canna indica]|uniref:O-fucosyltransferase family protein n=1 Tax=Canna indica TaxID=4628 RepID=A0AAQ3KP55_9LILI|nr:hypothetical protein Cni_G21250 [Canna indica]